jgi:alanyl-tRNA synthetase
MLFPRMDRKELINKYIEFFKSKDHKEIQNASLVPENDPTTLFIGSGMETIIPFLLGEKHPQGKRLTNFQRCVRTVDIENVGDSCHHTMFEMLGNWSLGDYWKKEAIELSFEFATKILGFSTERIAVTVFAGNKDAPKDTEAAEVWESLGIPKERISFLEDNWWGPIGKTGPCGPDTELFYWMPNDKPVPKNFDPEDEENWVEIWNDVLMQYNKTKEGKYIEASQKNIDNGRGLERVLSVINKVDDNYLTEIWQPLIKTIEKLSGKTYNKNKKEMRIIADHIKAATFIIADGIVPGNAEQGYVLRRLIRRAIRNLKKIGVSILEIDTTVEIAKEVIKIYDDYDILKENKQKIYDELKKEEDKFQKTLDKGLKEFQKMCRDDNIDGKECFLLYQSYGFPIEMTAELAEEKGITMDEKGFHKELDKHQELSRTASAGKFKSGLADNSEQTTKLHTACHLLNQALREVLHDDNIFQRGSNITSERLRFDFNIDRKLTEEEIKEIEDLVNKKIQENSPIVMEEIDLDKAKSSGAHGIFDSKYGEKVKVYSIGDFSKEICAGPHVSSTSELGHFKIIKEQSSSSGVRRIKAILE